MNILADLFLSWNHSKGEDLCLSEKPRDGAPIVVTGLTMNPQRMSVTESSFPFSLPITYTGFLALPSKKLHAQRSLSQNLLPLHPARGTQTRTGVIQGALLRFWINFLPFCLYLNSKINFYLPNK